MPADENPDAWKLQAQCRGLDPAIFFPDDGDYRAAAQVCVGCPVIVECRRAGRHEYGWWGGRLGGDEPVQPTSQYRT